MATSNVKNTLPLSKGNWLYVGGSGPGNYSTIQDAINNSSNGDTVFVYRGVYSSFFYPGDTTDYTCCVVIRNSIRLIGEDKDETIIDGPRRFDVVSIRADQVTVSGFTLQHGGVPGTGAYGRGLDIQQRKNITASHIILRDNYLGVILNSVSNILLDDVSFISNGGGISFWNGKNCTISSCTFNHAGISNEGFPPKAGGSLIIRDNVFINDSGISLGYLCLGSHGNTTIESNLFQNNTCPIDIHYSSGVNFWKNNFINNKVDVGLSQEYSISQFLICGKYRQNWRGNYWDDWDHTGRYAIRGTKTLDIGIPLIIHFKLVIITIPILRISYREYDPDPAQEPYEIPTMN